MLLFRALLGLWLLLPFALQAQRVTTPSGGSRPADPAGAPKVVAWRRDIHQHPELSNQGSPDRKLVADHLTSLGLEVKTGVAKTGVVGVLKGAKPGPVVALRADMDALPVTEQVDVPQVDSAGEVEWAGSGRDARLRP